MVKRFAFFFFGLLAAAGCADSAPPGGTGGVGGSETRGAGGIDGAGYLQRALELHAVVRPSPDCVYTTDLSQALSEGQWDLASPDDYLIGLVVENKLDSRVENELQGELHNIQVTSVQVTLLGPDGVPLESEQRLPNLFTVTASAIAPVADLDQPALALAFIRAIPAAYAEALSGLPSEELTAELRAFGSLSDGTPVRTDPLQLPIRLCTSCLAQECVTPEPPAGTCTPGQDGEPWCR